MVSLNLSVMRKPALKEALFILEGGLGGHHEHRRGDVVLSQGAQETLPVEICLLYTSSRRLSGRGIAPAARRLVGCCRLVR